MLQSTTPANQPPVDETIAELVARLGPPPELVVEDWVEQFVTLHLQYPQHQQQFTADQLTLAHGNRLIARLACGSQLLADLNEAKLTTVDWSDLEKNTQQAVTRFVHCVDPLRCRVQDASLTPDTPSNSFPATATDAGNRPRQRKRKRKRHSGRLPVWAIVAGVLLLIAVVVAGFGGSFRQRPLETTQRTPPNPKSRPDVSDGNHTPSPPNDTPGIDWAFDGEPASAPDTSFLKPDIVSGAERFADAAARGTTDDLLNGQQVDLPLGALDFGTLSRPTGSSGPGSADRGGEGDLPQPIDQQSDQEGSQDEMLTEEDADAVPDNPVRLQASQAVHLDTLSDSDGEADMLLLEAAVQEIRLLFPGGNSDWQLVDQADGRWHLLRSEMPIDAEPIATIFHDVVDDLQKTVWRWNQPIDAARSSGLSNGRLHLRSNDLWHTVFLRPSIEIDPITFDFRQWDYRQAWPLQTAPEATASRWSLQFHLPEKITAVGVNPCEGQLGRRASCEVQLHYDDTPQVAVRLQCELLAGRRLLLRQRVAVRLDDDEPWRKINLPQLVQFLEQRASQQDFLDERLQYLKSAYAIASTRQRDLLRIQRQQVEQQIKVIAGQHHRGSQLRMLLEHLEDLGFISLRIVTDWPNDQQSIVTTSLPEAS